MTTDLDAYTPARIRQFAALVYRLASGNIMVREVGDFLARTAAAADESGDLLQQRDALRLELSRLQQATAEADAQRTRADALQADLAEALKAAHAARTIARRECAAREKLEAEVLGSRLWFELARLLVDEARPLLPADKAKLLDPLHAARVAASDRAKLAATTALLRRAREWASLAADNANDRRAAAQVKAIDAHLEQP